MIKIEIPGKQPLLLKHLVLDYNGTLAIDGSIVEGVKQRLNTLSEKLDIHVITADTFGRAAENLKGVDCELVILDKKNQQQQKAEFIVKLNKENVVAMGNGLNDKKMLEQAALGIVLIQTEGASVKTLQSADIVINSIVDSLDLLLYPLRLTATLRV